MTRPAPLPAADPARRRRARPAACLVMAVALGACASAGDGGGEGGSSGGAGGAAPSLTGRPGCFYARDARDFRVLGTSSLLVFAPDAAHAYQVTITPAAWELRSAFGIAFAGSGGRICGAAGDRLFVDGGGSSRQGYSVIAVNALDDAAVALLTGRARDPKEPPPPAAAPGAAIETDPDEEGD